MVGRDKGCRRGASRPARARVRRRLAGLLVTLQGPQFTLGEPKSAAAAILQRSPARCSAHIGIPKVLGPLTIDPVPSNQKNRKTPAGFFLNDFNCVLYWKIAKSGPGRDPPAKFGTGRLSSFIPYG